MFMIWSLRERYFYVLQRGKISFSNATLSRGCDDIQVGRPICETEQNIIVMTLGLHNWWGCDDRRGTSRRSAVRFCLELLILCPTNSINSFVLDYELLISKFLIYCGRDNYDVSNEGLCYNFGGCSTAYCYGMVSHRAPHALRPCLIYCVSPYEL
jgi:hypothetical protein